MILIKGKNVSFEMADGRWLHLPKGYGIIHDPDGSHLERCSVYVGPYKVFSQRAKLTKEAEAYFGPDYQGMTAEVDVPLGPWSPIGEATQIRYYRPGTKYRGKYFHFFEGKTPVRISKCKKHFQIELPGGCIVNWRGFVYP